MLKSIISQEIKNSKIDFANIFKYWRINIAKLSQQNLHDFCKDKDIPVYNSQIAYLEKTNLDPKLGFYYGLEYLNKEIADKNNKFTYVKNKSLRDKLKQAKPFLTHDNKVADRGDFALMMLNIQPINKKYISSNVISINDELALQYTKLIREEFHSVRREFMMTGKEVIEKLCLTSIGGKVKKEDVDFLKDVITEEKSFDGKHLTYLIKKYGTLPCMAAVQEIQPSENLKSFGKKIGL
nr:hypothetical protein [uncultured Mediterranean phage uvMED]